VRGRAYALCQLGLLAIDRRHFENAREFLRESLQLRWSEGLRGSAVDTLEALAEATWQLGDLSLASNILCISGRLRQETGLARQPAYERRYQRVAQAVQAVPTAEQLDLDAMVATLIAIPPRAAAITT
jgi:hypothetical protein